MNEIQFTRENFQLFQAIRGKVEKEFKEKLPYNNLVRTFCVNDHELRHGFVHFFGQSIRDYQEQLRVQYACELMQLNPHMSVLEVAFDAGYNERSTFYRAFLRLRRMTPGEWKRRNIKQSKT